ncbi:MAG: sugar phosphate isomerase/epimerase family protein [Candidatus Hydrothermarchaeaceae archaeon]
MKLGTMNNPEKDVLKEIRFAGEMGFDFFEVTIEGPRAYPEILEERKDEVLDALSSYDMPVIAHLPWFFEIGHPYELVRSAYMKETYKVLEAAHSLGAEKLGLHINVPKGRFPDKLKRNIASLKEVKRRAENLGVVLCAENYDLATFDLDEFRRILDTGVGFLWDIGHANMRLVREEDILSFLEFKAKLSHVHVHDNDGRDDQHLPIGAGRIDWKLVLKELKRVYDGTITLEIHSQDRDYLEVSREKFLELWG